MADRKQLSDDELDEAMRQAAAAADLARAAGLEVAGEIAALRAGQAGIEGARLRWKRGRDAPGAALPDSAASVRAERGTAAADIGAAAREEIGKLLKTRPGGDTPARPDGDTPERPGRPEPSGSHGFTVRGNVIEGRSGVPDLSVEARTAEPVKTAGRARTGEKGEFTIEIADVHKLKRELELPEDKPLMLVLVALRQRRIVARSEAPFEAKPGEAQSATLAIG